MSLMPGLDLSTRLQCQRSFSHVGLGHGLPVHCAVMDCARAASCRHRQPYQPAAGERGGGQQGRSRGRLSALTNRQ